METEEKHQRVLEIFYFMARNLFLNFLLSGTLCWSPEKGVSAKVPGSHARMANEKVDIVTGQAPQAFNPFCESNDDLNLGTTDLRISTFPTANMLAQPMLEASFLLN